MGWRAPTVYSVVAALTFMFVPASMAAPPADPQEIPDGLVDFGARQIRLSDKLSAYPSPRQLWRFEDASGGATDEPFPPYPVIRAGRVVAEVMTDDVTSTMRVWDARSGAEIKRMARNLVLGDRAIYGGSYFDGGPLDVLDAYDLTTGKLRWTKTYDRTFYPIIETRGVLYGENRTEDNSAMYRSITAADGATRWTSGRYTSKALYFEQNVVGDGLYLGDKCGSVTKLSTATGKKVWSTQFSCPNDPYAYQKAPVGYGSRLYVRVKDGDYRVLDTATGKVLATRSWDQMPVVDGEIGYFIKDKVMSTVNLRTGKTLWQLHVTRGVRSVVAAGDGRVVIWANTGNAYLLESLTGKVRWVTSQPISGFDGGVALSWGRTAISAWAE